jgi:hypothetical protein
MTQYQQILNLEVQHEYFEDDPNNDLIITPDETTQRWLQSQGMVFSQQGNKGYLLMPENRGFDEIENELPDSPLIWHITSNDPSFVYYTDLPLDQLGQLVFSNEDTPAGMDQGPELEKTFISSADTRGVLVVIQINLDKAVREKSSHFLAKLQVRSTRWKYYIINSSGQNFGQLQLQGAGQELFEGPIATTLINGDSALLFDSGDNRIPLKSNTPLDLSLSATLDNNGLPVSTKLIDHLPGAQPDILQPPEEPAQKYYCSAIYVYL